MEKYNKQQTVIINKYRNGNLVKQITCNGTLREAFTRYTNLDDTYRYCNNVTFRFADEEVQKLYRQFLDEYKGNFFLDCAVSRGALID